MRASRRLLPLRRRLAKPAAPAVALLLLALLPAQLAAHCGVPFPGLAGHDHHAAAAGAESPGPDGALRAWGEHGACAIAAPTFTLRREPASEALGLPLASRVAPAALPLSPAAARPPLPVLPALSGRPSPPLRI